MDSCGRSICASPRSISVLPKRAAAPPHLTGRDFLRHFDIPAKSPEAHALTSEDFTALAKSYGRLGGLDRLATVVKSVRAERGQDRVLLLDGGDTFHGTLGSYRTKGQDVADCFKLLKPDAGTAHWEFTYGEARVKELAAGLGYPLLALNVRDTKEKKHVFAPYKIIEKGGVRIAVLGHAYPHTALMHPQSVLPPWTFGLREEEIRAAIERARREGVSLVVLLSQNGFDADRKLASHVDGIDVILTAHGDDALPEPVRIGKTLLVASGSHGKFVSRLDLDVRPEGLRDFRYKLIPLFADAIQADPEMAAAVEKARAPFAAELSRVVGHTESLLYRRDTFRGTFCDLMCTALIDRARCGDCVLSRIPLGHDDTARLGHHGGGHLQRHRHQLSAGLSHHHDRAAHQGSAGRRRRRACATAIPISGSAATWFAAADCATGSIRAKPLGSRISALEHNGSGKAIEPAKSYTVAGWGSVADQVEGPPIWEVIETHLGRIKTVRTKPQTNVRVVAGLTRLCVLPPFRLMRSARNGRAG